MSADARRSASPAPPRAAALRLAGSGAARARAERPPLGARWAEDAEAIAIALGPDDDADVASVARALPDPDAQPPGALVVILPRAFTPSLGARLLASLGRGRTVSRALRCTALVARGYVDVGAGVDPATRADLAWGYAPGRALRNLTPAP